jgi:hypothetical protein
MSHRSDLTNVEVAHGGLGRPRRLAKSFENTTTSATGWLQVACIAITLRHLSREEDRPWTCDELAGSSGGCSSGRS